MNSGILNYSDEQEQSNPMIVSHQTMLNVSATHHYDR